MHRTLRNIHLALALLSLPLLLLYAVSAVQLTHSAWFKLKPAVVETKVTATPASANARTLARELMDRNGLRGELQQVSESPSGYKLRIVRPGAVYEIDYTRQTGAANIRTSTAGFLGILNRLHHAAGFWHDYWLINLWSIFAALASTAILALGVSGVWLWFSRRRDRALGIALLAVNLVYSLTLLIMIRFP